MAIETDIASDMKQPTCRNCSIILNKKNRVNDEKRCKKCKNDYNNELRKKIKNEVLAIYGNACACCKCTVKEFLTIDHIDGRGALHRKLTGRGTNFYSWLKKNNYPKDNYQILCFNCNFAKHVFDVCPHQKDKLLHNS